MPQGILQRRVKQQGREAAITRNRGVDAHLHGHGPAQALHLQCQIRLKGFQFFLQGVRAGLMAAPMVAPKGDKIGEQPGRPIALVL